MVNSPNGDRLHRHLAYMIDLETSIEQRLESLCQDSSAHNEVNHLLSDLVNLAAIQRQALENRLNFLNGGVSTSPAPDITAIQVSRANEHPISAALQVAYGLLSQAIVGYAIMHPLATRFADSLVIADEGTCYHLCRAHAQAYIEGVQKISGLLPDVVLWELEQAQLECRCSCPSCGVGICVCALAGRDFLREAWSQAGVIAADHGVDVQSPRQGSVALQAGLRQGDLIFAAEGRQLESYADLQDAVRAAGPGTAIQLSVKHDDDRTEDVSLLC